MSEFERESLSALLDGEVEELELRRILQKSEMDPSLLETWGRYNLVHSALTAEAVPASSGFASAVADQLDSEPSYNLSASSAVSSAGTWRQNLTKLAIAASVALIFVVGLQTANEPNSPAVAGTNQPLAPATQEANPGPEFILASADQTEPDPEALKRLSDYLGKAMFSKDDEPVHIEHIQDSPLYRLVNNLQAKP
jgi:sigma-E factor negative regulatory protein RseA